jgi:hypothetical protein
MTGRKAIEVDLEGALERFDSIREAISRAADWAQNTDAADDIAKTIFNHASLFARCNGAIEDILCLVQEYKDPGS